MSILDIIRGEFLEVIEWVDTSDDIVVWKFPDRGNRIMNGAKLTVRESQVAVFVNEGEIGDVFGPGLHTLTTQNMPVTTTLKSWKYLFNSPFKVDIYFVNTRQFTDQKWGTPAPIIMRDKELGQVRLRAFGNFSWRVADAGTFIRELAGTRPLVKAEDVEGQLTGIVNNRIAEALAESGVTVYDLAQNYTEVGQQLLPGFRNEVAAWGIQIEKFYIENVSLPEEVEKMLDKRTGMNILGKNLDDFNKMQTGIAIEKMADNPGAGDAAGLGVGVLMSNMMNQHAQPAQPSASSGESQAGDKLDLLKKLAELKDAGILTDEEFQQKKKDILAGL